MKNMLNNCVWISVELSASTVARPQQVHRVYVPWQLPRPVQGVSTAEPLYGGRKIKSPYFLALGVTMETFLSPSSCFLCHCWACWLLKGNSPWNVVFWQLVSECHALSTSAWRRKVKAVSRYSTVQAAAVITCCLKAEALIEKKQSDVQGFCDFGKTTHKFATCWWRAVVFTVCVCLGMPKTHTQLFINNWRVFATFHKIL